MTKIHGLELADRRLKVRVIAETVYISKGRVSDIVHETLGTRKLLVRLVHTRDQGTVEAVDFTKQTCSEEGEDYPIGKKGDGHRFLGVARCELHRLPVKGQNGHKALLCRIIGLEDDACLIVQKKV